MATETTAQADLAENPGESETTGDAALDFLLNKEAKAPTQQEPDADEHPEEEEEEESEEVELTEDEEVEDDDDPEIDLGEIKLRKSELKAGYMKDADYRQKTAAAAQATRDAQAIADAARQEREYYANQLDATLQLAHTKLIGDQQRLAELAQTDPAEWVALNAQIQERYREYEALIQSRQVVSHQQQQAEERQHAEYVKRETEALHAKLPSWQDKKVVDKESREIADFLLSEGYSVGDLNDLQDHRALIIARKAAKYDALVKARDSAKDKKVTATPPATLRPGVAKNAANQQSSQVADLAKRAKRTHSQQDAIAYLMSK